MVLLKRNTADEMVIVRKVSRRKKDCYYGVKEKRLAMKKYRSEISLQVGMTA